MALLRGEICLKTEQSEKLEEILASLAQDVIDEDMRGSEKYYRGWLAFTKNEFEKSEELLKSSLAYFEGQQNSSRMIELYKLLALVTKSVGHYKQSAVWYEKAVEQLEGH